MKNLATGLMTFFNALDESDAHNSFYNDIPGRLFYGKAEGILLSEGAYVNYFIINDVDFDTFTENMVYIYIQFSIFSGSASVIEIMDILTHLSAWLKDTIFTVTSETVVHAKQIQSDGPYDVPANTEAGTSRYWQTDVDFEILINRV